MGLGLHGQFKGIRPSCCRPGVRIVLRNHFHRSTLRRQTSRKRGGFSLVAYLLSDCFLRNVVRTFARGSCNSALRLRCYGTWTRACRPDNIQSRRKMQRNYSFRSQQFHRHRRLWGSVGRTSDTWMDRLSFIARNCLVLGVGFLCIGFCDLIDSSAPERPTESQRLIGAVNSSLILR